MTNINKKIIIEGDTTHSVGYRPFLLEKALELEIPNFSAKNVDLENGKQMVIVSVSGKDSELKQFIEFIKENSPLYAKVDKVSEEENQSKVMSIDHYLKLLGVEQQNNIIQGGLQISDKLDIGFNMLGEKVDSLRTETNDNFKKMDDNFSRMDEKYHIISERMFDLVDAIEKRQQSFDMHIEKIDKNIETLLEILAKKEK